MFKNTFVGAIALLSLGATALAHNGATGVVMERMMGMSAMRDVLRDLAPMMQGQAPYNARVVQESAATIMAHAGGNMNALFPEEPIPAASFAKPEIWQDWARFTALSEELRLAAFGLAMAAPKGLIAPAAVSTAVQDPMAGMDHSTMQAEPPTVQFTVPELMGVTPLSAQAPMIALPSLADGQSAAQIVAVDFAAMAADDVFEMVSQTCASCHSLFRSGN